MTPLANRFLGYRGDPERRYLLRLVRCDVCELVQITHTVPPEELFSNYLYYSSHSPALVDSARKLVDRLILERDLGPDSLVIEAGSNDGYLLNHYKDREIGVMGVDPSGIPAGVRTVREFFGHKLAGTLPQCDIFHANNVLPHVADLNGFVAGIKTVLKPDGIAVIECSDVNCMFEQTQFDFIYHEHLCYFSPTSLFHLFKRHNLDIAAMERIPIHGESLRVFVRHPQSYADFSANTARLGLELRKLVRGLVHDQGKVVAGYGAAAKATMLLNYCGIDELAFICDATPAKQGKFMPGMRTPIVSPEELASRQPDYCLILAWNYAEQIMGNEHDYRGKWIIPIPVVRCVDSQYGGRPEPHDLHRGDTCLDSKLTR